MPTIEPCQRDADGYCYRHTDPRICDALDAAGVEPEPFVYRDTLTIRDSDRDAIPGPDD